MHRFLAVVAVLAVWAPATLQADGLVVERVFGPEIKTGPYKHPACLTELDGGGLLLVYYGGTGEYATDTAVYASLRKPSDTAWPAPAPIARDPFRSVGNAVVWQAPDSVVWLFYVVRDGTTWSTSRVQFKVSRDGAKSWSDASVLSNETGTMVRNRPIVLSDGRYLLPAYHETGQDPESVGADSASVFFGFDPKRPERGWERLGSVRSPRGNIQPAPAEVAPGRLVAYCRRGGDYAPTTRGFIVRSESRDGGKTWTEGVDSAFPNPNAAVDFLRLASGSLLLVYNDAFAGRTPLAVALSTDGDQSYPRRRNLAEGPGDFGYPQALQARDGRIHVVYTSEKRTVVNHAVFDESWLAGGR